MTGAGRGLTAVWEHGRDPEVVLPHPGQRVAVTFEDCCAGGEVGGVVASVAYDDDRWPKTRVRFEDGSTVAGFDWWRELSKWPKEGHRERLAELKRTNVPRLDYDRLERTVEFVTHPVTADDVAAIDAYLRAFAWVTDDDGRMVCPCCLTEGWTVGRASHACSCGWPGTRDHLVTDQSDDAACARCGQPRRRHVTQEVEFGPGLTRVNYLCLTARTFKPPVLLELEDTLWAHPYDVKIGR